MKQPNHKRTNTVEHEKKNKVKIIQCLFASARLGRT